MLPQKHGPPAAVWQGWLDSNQRVRESKSLALPLGYTPVYLGKGAGRSQKLRPFRLDVGWVKGLEPSTPGTTIRCSNQLSYTHHITDVRSHLEPLVRLKGLEPPARCLEGSCSIHLSYRRISTVSLQRAPAPAVLSRPEPAGPIRRGGAGERTQAFAVRQKGS